MNSQTETTVEFRTHRFDPQQKKPYVSVYTVPVRKGMTILDALVYVKDNLDETLSFRHSCRMGQCGSCGVMVNGTPMLACYTQVLHLESDVLVVEPLSNMPIIKDLIVDVQPFFETYNKIKSFLVKAGDESKTPNEFVQMPADLKKYWDLTLCTKCSICYSICPAAIDEVFPGPSTLAANYRFISDSRDEGSDERVKAMTGNIWPCTSCNSCTLSCPKEVDSSSSIVDERSLIIETGSIPKSVMDVLTSAFKYHNPIAMRPNKRMEWAKDLGVRTFPTVAQADILYFVCCLTAYDLRNQEIARSMASLFNRLGADFATLGKEEWCCGDHILRLGEKGLFETLAEHNISMFEKSDVERIVTLSPHCYNTFRNDKPYSDVGPQVQHYTQFVAEAIEQSKLKLHNAVRKRVTYHDPCFLGKRNEIYDAPRQILESINGLELVEMKRARENSFCCGGGAGRIWTEDATPEKRSCVNRVREALELEVEVMATACPFCVTTLEDATKVLDVEDRIIVMDILELLEESM
ncbi:MAG: succinate dehydrogenase iron-sulfur subunit [Candidatus Bathyarchaeota archaeon]|nr:MAG: succinate dehydrogenase iron-sulfur subunit [Candidatus Bathyarchaeota archaeon]